MAEVGVWRNTLSPDPEIRKASIRYAIGQLELADRTVATGLVCLCSAMLRHTRRYPPGNQFMVDHSFCDVLPVRAGLSHILGNLPDQQPDTRSMTCKNRSSSSLSSQHAASCMHEAFPHSGNTVSGKYCHVSSSFSMHVHWPCTSPQSENRHHHIRHVMAVPVVPRLPKNPFIS